MHNLSLRQNQKRQIHEAKARQVETPNIGT